jgi:hypothetical protein
MRSRTGSEIGADKITLKPAITATGAVIQVGTAAGGFELQSGPRIDDRPSE